MIYQTDIDFTLTYIVKKIIRRAVSDGRYLINVKVVDFTGYPKKTGFPTELSAFGFFGTISVNDTFKSTASFIADPRYGYRFSLKGTPERVFPSSEKEVAKYLSSHINGLGLKTATDIAKEVGPSAITKIPEHPDCLDGIPGLKGKKKANVIAWCQDNLYCEQVLLYMHEHSVPLDIARSMYDRFGKLAITKLNENPYSIYESGNIPFKYAEQIASNLGRPWNDQNRLQGAIRAAIDNRIDSHGDTCVLGDQIMKISEHYLMNSKHYDPAICCLKPGQIFSAEKYKDAINTLTDAGELIPYTVNENGCDETYYYRKQTLQAEKTCANKIHKMLTEQPVIQATKHQIDRYLNKIHKDLAPEQMAGVIMAATNKFSVLTGGPGTGKTYTMKALIDTLKYFKKNIKIVQAAPTAKAASKMREATGLDADTLHAVFHMTPIDFGKENKFILDADFLIVDESSMIGIDLFSEVLSHIGERTCVLMVGDPAQLPSISCGTVLQSLCECGTVPVTELSVIHRQSEQSTIVYNAHLIRTGNPKKIDQIKICNPQTGANKDFVFLSTNNEDQISNKIVNIVKILTQKKHVPIAQILVLTPVHATTCGTDILNSLLQDQLNPLSPDEPKYTATNLKIFHRGDRVMNTRNFKINTSENELPRKVKNGDVGYVIDVIDETSVEVKFDDEEDTVVFNKNHIDYLELAYAMTIHKSQGSEADCVIMPFSSNPIHRNMLNRPIIYTAITRSRSHFYGVGSFDAFISGCKCKNDDDKRLSLFSRFLRKNVG